MNAMQGKTALIIGASRGIGLAVAKRFAAEGAHVFITGRDPERLNAAAAEIGASATPVTGDVANLDELDRIYRTIADRASHLDVVVANAAIGNNNTFAEVTPAEYDTVFNTNTRGAFFGVQKALPLLCDDAAVVLISSGLYLKGQAGSSVYSAAKATLRSFARTWTVDLAPRRIRVNVITVGGIDSGIWERNAGSTEAAAPVKAAVAAHTTLGRMGRPDEVAAAVLFMASDDASYITGTELIVDGGFLLK